MEAVSPREAEVLVLVGEGLTNAQIAARCYISVRTAESHVSALLRKLELPDRRALAAHARAGPAAGGGAPDRGLQGAPVAFTSFIGRDHDLDVIAAELASARLVTLAGPGGIGKTRLAAEVGRRHPATSKWFVDLVPAAPEQVLQTIATALGALEQPNLSLADSVLQAIGGGPALLVLDNCEHVLDAVAGVLGRVLASCADAVVLATSREVLGVPGEHVVPVPPLSVAGNGDGAVALFETRAADAGAAIEARDRDAVIEICTRLDGVPLAIELAAARCATLGVDGVLAALGDRLRLLTGARGPDERHRSLRAVLDWSHSLLDAEEQAVLRRVAVFHGGFLLADAAEVAGGDMGAAAAIDAVGRLAAKSLAVHARGETTDSVFRLLEMVREYGLEKLQEAEEVASIRDLHLRWAIDIAGALEYELESNDAVGLRLDALLDDLRAALGWAAANKDFHAAHVLARRLAHLAYARRFLTEAGMRYEEAAEYAADDGEAARDLLDAAHVAFGTMHGDRGFEYLLIAADRAERAGDVSTAAVAIALAAERGNRFPAEFAEVPSRAALEALRERAEILGTDGDARVAAQLANTSAWLSATREASATEPIARAALEAARRIDDPVLESSALDALAAAVWADGRLAESARIETDRVALLERMPVHDPRACAEQLDILHMAADTPLSRGDLPRALAFSSEAMGHPLAAGAMHVLHRELLVALCLTGRFEEAIDESGAMRAAWERLGRPVAGWMAPATYLTMLVYGLRGESAESTEWARICEVVSLSPDNAMRAFATLRLALHEGRLDDAAREIDRYANAVGSIDSEFPWSLSSLGYEGYTWSAAAEVWAERGEPDTAQRIESLRTAYAEHLWVEPVLARAEGRLHRDAARLRVAASGFAAIGARFEEAATLALLDGDEGARGRATLTELGCSPPVARAR
jgi:predicted ATPase/DNA-binding CsgD family transcriptional regulator